MTQDNGEIDARRSGPLRSGWLGAGLLLAGLTAPAASAAQQPAASFPVGQIIERVWSPDDPRESWALYLPSRYRSDARFPVLFMLDPRGHALVPLKLALAAAERHGYIVLSSYNSLSDGPAEPNVAAMDAMLHDAQRRLSIDPRRLYLAGFSGTARMSWLFADGLRGYVAGILGFGAGLPPEYVWSRHLAGERWPFAFFGGAGTTDFNYEELHALDQELARRDFPHRIRYYDSPHSWPPEAVMAEGLDWLELQAMTQGLSPMDRPWVDSLLAVRRAEAARLESQGELVRALEEYQEIVADFAVVGDVTPLRTRADALARSEPVRHRTRQLEQIARRHDEYIARLRDFLIRFRTAASPPKPEVAIRELKVAELQKQIRDSADTIQAQAARRLMAHVMAYTSFYEPQDYFASGDARRALAMLDIADALRPGQPGICHGRARALLLLGRTEDALPLVECWSHGAHVPADTVAADSTLAGLRALPSFQQLLERLRREPSGS